MVTQGPDVEDLGNPQHTSMYPIYPSKIYDLLTIPTRPLPQPPGITSCLNAPDNTPKYPATPYQPPTDDLPLFTDRFSNWPKLPLKVL